MLIPDFLEFHGTVVKKITGKIFWMHTVKLSRKNRNVVKNLYILLKIIWGNMTETDAGKIIDEFKSGLAYMEDDPLKSMVICYRYDRARNLFVNENFDTVVGANLGETDYDESGFLSLLIRKYDYAAFMSETYREKDKP